MQYPRIVERSSFTIVGVTVSGQPGEINYADVWARQYAPLVPVLRPLSVDNGSYGASFTGQDKTTYIAGVAVAEETAIPQGLEQREIPAARYAVFDCTLSTMAATVQEAYGQWFHASGMQPDDDAANFEYYLPHGGAGEMHVEIYIPIKRVVENQRDHKGVEMNVFDAIFNRRSIRKYKSDAVPKDALHRILQAGILAPSGMNRQPWKFFVVQGEKRADMIAILNEGLSNREKEGKNISGARHSFEVMAQAPTTVLIYRPNRKAPWLADSMEQYFRDLVDVQSIGAAIQNMILTAEELGIGSLWVCDIFSAQAEISAWLGESTEMIAALCLGYADEHPVARKRKSLEEVVINV